MKTEHGSQIVPAPTSAVGAPWRYKVPVLLCILFVTLGATYTTDILPPLKSCIMQNTSSNGVQTNRARYGVITASSTLVNTILPLIAGIVIDYYGVSLVVIFCTVVVFVGAVLTAVGTERGSFGIILGGQIIAGIGSNSINTCQNKIYAHWFRGTAAGGPGLIGFVAGIDIAMNRIFALMASQSAVPLYHASGKWYMAFWVSVIFSGFSVLLSIIYVILEARLPREMQLPAGRHINPVKGTAARRLGAHMLRVLSAIVNLPASFWVLVLLQTLQSGVVASYKSNLADVVRVTRNTSMFRAGWTSGMDYIIPIVLTPAFGLLFDYTGRRSYYVSYTAAVYIVAFALLAFTRVHELAPILLGSLAYTTNSIPFMASLPLLVPSQRLIGTAYGVWRTFNAAGETIMDVASGAIQDISWNRGSHLYDNMFYVLIAIKGADFFFGFTYHILDRRYFGSAMTMSEKQRVKVEAIETDADRTQGMRVPRRFWTILGCTVAIAMIITAYVLYIYYSVVNTSAKPGSL